MQPAGELMAEIVMRRVEENRIRERLDEYCRRQYGIPHWSSITRKYLPFDGMFRVCLARQIPTINVEHTAVELLPTWLAATLKIPTEAEVWALPRDSYTGSNAYKRALVGLPWLRRGRKGRYLNTEWIVERRFLEGRILDSIPTRRDKTIPDFHHDLRLTAFGQDGNVVNLSPYHRECLRQCLVNRPDAGPKVVFLRRGHIEQRTDTSAVGSDDDIRAPATWYYRFSLMLLMDGTRALLSTVGDTPEVEGWFTQANAEIKAATGFAPLIIETPEAIAVDGFRSMLIEYPAAITERPDWRESIVMPRPNSKRSVFSVVNQLERAVIRIV